MPYVLPEPAAKRKWYNDYGEYQGIGARILLAMLSGGTSGVPGLGKQPTTPTTQNPGQIQFPSGAKTSTSPLELAMIQQMGGAPSSQGGTVPVSYQPPMQWGFTPNTDQALKQAQLQQTQAYSKYLSSLTGTGLPGQMSPTPSTPQTPSGSPSSLTPQLTTYLAKRALAGDAEADAVLKAAGY